MLVKAWESKTGQKVKQVKKKKSVRHNDSDFSGRYSTLLGKAKIHKDSKDTYLAETDNGTFKLYKTNKNRYK